MPVKDRLMEMKEMSGEAETSPESVTVEIKPKKKNKVSKVAAHLTSFLEKVNLLEEKLKNLALDVEKMKRLQSDMLCAPTYDKEKVKQMEQVSDDIMNKSNLYRKEIDTLAPSTSATKEQGDRVKSTQYQHLMYELSVIMNDYRTAQAEYIDKVKARYDRQLHILGKTNTDDKSYAIDYGEPHALFTENVLMETEAAKAQLIDLEDRSHQILGLEKQVVEMNKLFKDVMSLVSEQGEMINSIEKNVVTAVDYVGSGKDNLGQAREKQKSARKKKIICVVIVAVVILIIVIIVAVTVS